LALLSGIGKFLEGHKADEEAGGFFVATGTVFPTKTACPGKRAGAKPACPPEAGKRQAGTSSKLSWF